MDDPTQIFPYGGDELRNWLRTSASNLFEAFETGAAFLEHLRSEGAAIRTSDFYDIRRQVLERVAQDQRLIDYGTDQLVPAAWHMSDHGWQISQDYLYIVKVYGEDPITHDQIETFLSVSSSRQLSMDEIFDTLDGMILGEEEFYEIRPEQMTLDRALVKPGVYG